MASISTNTFSFLRDLQQNNYRDWFKENKGRYDEAKAEFEVFIDALISGIAKFDPSVAHNEAKKSIFRIYRDVRFSKDKSPYKTHLGAHITSAEKRSEVHSRAGYYIHIGPGESMLAGGAYLPQGPWIKGIRNEIDQHTDEFKKIINGRTFKKYFGEIEGEKLKTAPKGYPKDHPEIDLLRYKSFLAVNRNTDKEVCSDDYLKHCTRVFKTIQPFDDFLNRSLA